MDPETIRHAYFAGRSATSLPEGGHYAILECVNRTPSKEPSTGKVHPEELPAKDLPLLEFRLKEATHALQMCEYLLKVAQELPCFKGIELIEDLAVGGASERITVCAFLAGFLLPRIPFEDPYQDCLCLSTLAAVFKAGIAQRLETDLTSYATANTTTRLEMTLTEEQLEIIAKHALNDSISDFTAKLGRLEGSNEAWRTDIALLLGLLVATPAAYNLPSRDGSSNVAVKLFPIQQNVRGGSFRFDHFRPLIDAVAADSPDTDVWDAVINLIDAVNPSTPPPPSIIPTGHGTPVKTSSSRLEDSETRDIVERELFHEIRDCTHRGVPGFFEKHFDITKWTKAQKKMLELILANHDGAKWKDFPADPWEAAIWKWL
ncbi:hypothetical protein V2A60_008040 [Cordyceps javanica]